MVGLATTDPKEYQRQYRLNNHDKILARNRAHRAANIDKIHTQERNRSNYTNGRLNHNTATGRGFISEIVVVKAIGLGNDARCNCTTGFGFKYDLYDINEYKEINVKSSKLNAYNNWSFNLRNKYVPDTYIFVAYFGDYKNIAHVWIVPTHAVVVFDKKVLTVYNSDKSLSKLQEFEVDNTMYNVYLHTMSIDNCSVLKKQDFVEEMLECL